MSYEVRKVKLSKLHINTGQIAGVPKNPRFIRDEKFRKLCDSLEQDPEFTELKEVTAYEMEGGELVVVDGNMRFRAAKELKWKELTVKIIPTGTPADKIMRYIIKSNLAYGENDWDLIANEWDISELVEMGMDLPVALAGYEVDAEQMGDSFSLPEGEKQPFQQITFTLANEQAEEIKAAISAVKETADYKFCENFGNENSNGNAIYTIIKQWAELKK